MKKSTYKFPATGLLAVFAMAFVMAGCQSVTDKLVKTAMEKAIETSTGGQVKMDTNNGQMNIKTKDGDVKIDTSADGGTMKITSNDGETVFGAGDTRPASAPSDLPNLNGAKDFSWMGGKDGGMFSYTIPGTDYKAVCSQQIDLLTKAGWSLNNDYSIDVDKNMTRSLDISGFNLSLSCETSDDVTVGVGMIKSQKSS